jgi:hypothetical protein
LHLASRAEAEQPPGGIAACRAIPADGPCRSHANALPYCCDTIYFGSALSQGSLVESVDLGRCESSLRSAADGHGASLTDTYRQVGIHVAQILAGRADGRVMHCFRATKLVYVFANVEEGVAAKRLEFLILCSSRCCHLHQAQVGTCVTRTCRCAGDQIRVGRIGS